tara:strand:+ start:754 stop:1008 length:255 start_codon:yes stop_codon:yes gene_type:complete
VIEMISYKTGEAPVFVKIEDYKDILDVLELIKDRLAEAKRTLGDINELKNDEDAELELWSSTLAEIEKKLESIDRTLFEPESAY